MKQRGDCKTVGASSRLLSSSLMFSLRLSARLLIFNFCPFFLIFLVLPPHRITRLIWICLVRGGVRIRLSSHQPVMCNGLMTCRGYPRVCVVCE